MSFLDEITTALDNHSNVHAINASSHMALLLLPSDTVINKAGQQKPT